MTSEQRPPVNNGHYFGVPRVVIVHKFDCSLKIACLFLNNFICSTSFYLSVSNRSTMSIPQSFGSKLAPAKYLIFWEVEKQLLVSIILSVCLDGACKSGIQL